VNNNQARKVKLYSYYIHITAGLVKERYFPRKTTKTAQW